MNNEKTRTPRTLPSGNFRCVSVPINPWRRYEQEKQELRALLEAGRITPTEYDKRIREVARRLNI